jgi:uncharacterized membrane protein
MEMAILIIIILIAVMIAGLAGFFISMSNRSRIESLENKIHNIELERSKVKTDVHMSAVKEQAAAVPQEKKAERAAPVVLDAVAAKPIEIKEVTKQEPVKPVTAAEVKIEQPPQKASIEQIIGTRWVLIAGIITVIFGVGYFLKYAYDNSIIGPVGRVTVSTVAGLAALLVGEITRKRGYGIVSKGVTALGFAILYAAVFSAYRLYGLIDSLPAFGLSILVTAMAMLYAVGLNEIIIALLSLLGGFLTPILLSTGENKPISLFIYVFILSVGAMLCAQYRKWRAVNVLCFVCTFLLYTGWFEKFYRHAMYAANDAVPEQMWIALGGLGVFFVVYLLLPIFYEIVKGTKAQREDVLLILSNAVVTFYYLWTILYPKYRIELAFCAVGLCVAHLIVMTVVAQRSKSDVGLRLALLIIGIFFLTIAVPLYLKMYAVAIAWAAEGVVLTVIGLRYRSILTQVGGGIAFVLSISQLLWQLPLHKGAFTLIFNPAFGTWCFVAAALATAHLIYRRNNEIKESLKNILTQVFYASSVLLLFAAAVMEWFYHCEKNITSIATGDKYFVRGMLLLFTVFVQILVVRPISPQGILNRIIAILMALAGSLFGIAAITDIYKEGFIIFANTNFVMALIFVAGIFAAAVHLKQKEHEDNVKIPLYMIFGLLGVVVLWILLSEQIYLYWNCRNAYVHDAANWRFLANMYISIMWAVYGAVMMVIGFWRKSPILRYMALALFAIMLAKVFIFDMESVKSVYRIAAFLATGVTLVAVSYIYQHLKKKGFFETIGEEKK